MCRKSDEQIIKDMNEYYKNREMPKCEKCGNNSQVIPCVYGKPNKDLLIYAKAGYAELQGCCMEEKSKKAKCKTCNTYFY